MYEGRVGWVYEGSVVWVHEGSIVWVYKRSVVWLYTLVMNMNIGVAALCFSAFSTQPNFYTSSCIRHEIIN